jgi:5-hydroxyisourate hydrolase
MGIQVDSPLHRQWTILDCSGSIVRITATVLGACFSSSRAVNIRVPTRILSMPNTNRPTISTHVLDTTRGEPAAGVTVTLWRLDGTQPVRQSSRETDADGRIAELGDEQLSAGTYRMSFEVGAYYKKKGNAVFLQRATLDFEITDTTRRYHIPLLMSPFSCSSYRGS